MATLNGKRKTTTLRTSEGAPAKRISKRDQLCRSVMTCLLWEDNAYESGVSVGKRIADLCQEVERQDVIDLSIEAKYEMGLRHVPLWMIVSAKIFDKDVLKKLIRRTDDMAELLSMYWLDGKKPIPNQMKKAIAERINEFSEYQLTKYQGKRKEIALRDLIILTHPKPENDERAKLYKSILEGNATPPDTWEVQLSKGANKKETFERLISEGKLFALAFLRNLRGMQEAGVTNIKEGFDRINFSKILPYQFVQSAKYIPSMEDRIEEKMLEVLDGMEKMSGETLLLVDISGSMTCPLSSGQISRSEAAQGVTILARELFEDVSIFAFGNNLYEIPNRRGFALGDMVKARNEGTWLGRAVSVMNEKGYDRLIVITDEQSHDSVPNPLPDAKGYMINVANNRNGVGYGKWLHIDGWSHHVLRYIAEYEKTFNK